MWMKIKLERNARKACAFCEYVKDCSECSDSGIDFDPLRCKQWKWYLPFPLSLPAKIRWFLKIRSISRRVSEAR